MLSIGGMTTTTDNSRAGRAGRVGLAGDKPQRYISLGTLGCRCSGDGGWCRRPVPEFIFVEMTRIKSRHKLAYFQ